MTATEMNSKILAEVKRFPYSSFVGIHDACGEEARGNFCIEYLPNLVLWSGVSEKFVEAFKMALAQLEVFPTQALVYHVDGRVPMMPIAKSIRAFRHPRWLPTSFCLKPLQNQPSPSSLKIIH